MNDAKLKVTFQPSGRSVYVLPGTLVLEAAGRAGIVLQAPCGGRGTCGKCRVRLAQPDTSPAAASIGRLPPHLVDAGYRLACATVIDTSCVIEVPAESTFEHQQQILVADQGATHEIDPVRALDDAEGPMYGVAVDLGTTTLVGTLFDLRDGRECAVASRINPQVALGDDVITRIHHAREHATGPQELQTSIIEGLNALLLELTRDAGLTPDAIGELVLAGNTTMQQLACGYDCAPLGEMPFTQAFEAGHVLPATPLGLRVHSDAKVYVCPQVGSFVGGDTVAGMVATRLDRWEAPVLLVDIGTNGEIVLAANSQLLATSTAAGPAFEGARITQGMRAASGAIEKIMLTDDVQLNVIGNTRPAGLCGTALIDGTAELLRAGILETTGRILSVDDAPSDLSPAIRERLLTTDGETRFMLVPAEASATGEPICLWQRDIRELQLATGALRAGIAILLQRAGLTPDALSQVFLAGAFGNFIRRRNAQRIGLLPPIPREHIQFIGNAASLGAKRLLLSARERDYAAQLQRAASHVDLSRDAGFQAEFGAAMLFPEADVGLQPFGIRPHRFP